MNSLDLLRLADWVEAYPVQAAHEILRLRERVKKLTLPPPPREIIARPPYLAFARTPGPGRPYYTSLCLGSLWARMADRNYGRDL